MNPPSPRIATSPIADKSREAIDSPDADDFRSNPGLWVGTGLGVIIVLGGVPVRTGIRIVDDAVNGRVLLNRGVPVNIVVGISRQIPDSKPPIA
jgi:hypothetical protein